MASTRAGSVDDGWRSGSAAAAGFDTVRLATIADTIRAQRSNVHALLVERDGVLVYEQYFSGTDERWGERLPGEIRFDRYTKHDVRSISKSVTAALLGIALAGDTAALDRSIFDYFPEHADLATAEKRAVKVRHLLAMTAGFQWDEDAPYTDPGNDEIGMTRSADPVRYVLAKPLASAPGAKWTYSGGTTHVLAEIIQRITRRPLRDFARAALFEPLGITDWEWLGNMKGTPAAASGLRLLPRDLAKFGSLYLHEGRWNGRQVVPAAFVAMSLQPAVVVASSDSSGRDYGFHWNRYRWLKPSGTITAFAAVGNGEQLVYVLPEQRMVVTLLAGRYNDPSGWALGDEILLKHVLPALVATRPTQSASPPSGYSTIE